MNVGDDTRGRLRTSSLHSKRPSREAARAEVSTWSEISSAADSRGSAERSAAAQLVRTHRRRGRRQRRGIRGCCNRPNPSVRRLGAARLDSFPCLLAPRFRNATHPAVFSACGRPLHRPMIRKPIRAKPRYPPRYCFDRASGCWFARKRAAQRRRPAVALARSLPSPGPG